MRKALILSLVACAAMVARADTVTTNIYTNVTYNVGVVYTLKSVTNTVISPFVERSGRYELSCNTVGSTCYSMSRETFIATRLETAKTGTHIILGAGLSYTNVNGFVGICAKDLCACIVMGPALEAWDNTLNNTVFTSAVEYASMNTTPVISYVAPNGGSLLYLRDDAGIVSTAFGTNGLSVVTNIDTTVRWKDDRKIQEVLIPNITYTPVNQVGTNIFVNGINVTR